jgi:Tetratricopeptide repeat
LRGYLDEAERWHKKSLAIKERLDDQPRKATSYHQLGIVAQDLGRLYEAEGWLKKSLAIKETRHISLG